MVIKQGHRCDALDRTSFVTCSPTSAKEEKIGVERENLRGPPMVFRLGVSNLKDVSREQ